MKGNLNEYVSFWENTIRANETVCDILKNGYKLPFLYTHSNAEFKNNSSALKNSELVVGMSSLFINLILKTSHYLHMKGLNERISEWAHLSFYHKRFSRYLHLKFEKEVIFSGRFSPYEIPESGDKISNFCLYVLIMSRTRFRVNPHSTVA